MGGSSDTELKLFAVSPKSRPTALRVVTIVTPVAKAPSALRNRGPSSGWYSGGMDVNVPPRRYCVKPRGRRRRGFLHLAARARFLFAACPPAGGDRQRSLRRVWMQGRWGACDQDRNR